MRGIEYFNLRDSSNDTFLIDKETSDTSEPQIDLDDVAYWKDITGDQAIQDRTIQLLIPFHNSPHLEKTVKTLADEQIVPSEMKRKLIIVASACKDEYIKNAQEISETYSRENFEIQLVIQPEPGKPKALNTGIKSIDEDIIIQIVDDVVPSKYFTAVMWLSMIVNPNKGAAAAVGKPTNLRNDGLLFKIQKLHFDKFGHFEEYALIGRGFAFRKSLIPEGFPEHIMSEDFWLEIQVREKSDGFMVADHCFVDYQKPETWKDYLKQLDRFDGSFKQLQTTFPALFKKHFGEVNNTFFSMLGVEGDSRMDQVVNYLKEKNYATPTKIAYIFIVMYQLYYLSFKNKLFPVKSAAFKREESTLDLHE